MAVKGSDSNPLSSRVSDKNKCRQWLYIKRRRTVELTIIVRDCTWLRQSVIQI